jgi:hypothetical protein
MEKGIKEDREPSVVSATKALTDRAFQSISVLSNMNVEGGCVAFFNKYFLCLNTVVQKSKYISATFKIKFSIMCGE